jgi:hypothetical protein
MLTSGTEERHETAVRQVDTLSTSPHLALYVISTSFFPHFSFEGREFFPPLHLNYRIPQPFIMTSHKRGTIITNDCQRRILRVLFYFISFFAAYCDPLLASRKPFTNSFNLFPGLLFISAFIWYSSFHPGSVYFISLCFRINNEFCGSRANVLVQRDVDGKATPVTGREGL